MYYFLQCASAKITGKWYITSLALMLYVAGASSFAQEVEVKASIDSSAILIGDQITVHLEVSHPAEISLKINESSDTLVNGIEILLQSEFDTTFLEGNRISMKKEFLITCFDSGMYVIPPFEAFLTDTSISATFRSIPLYLWVTRTDTQPADSTDLIFDIKLPYGAPVSFREVLPYLLGGVLLLGLATFLILFLKKRKKDEPILRKIKPVEPAHVIALRELDRIKSEKIWQQGKVKLYYTRLTEVLRIYLENRYGILAMEQTSSDTLHSLLEIGFNDNRLYDKIEEILYLADMAKFAKANPLPNENENSLLSSYIFVNETKEAWMKVADAENEVSDEKTEFNEAGSDS